MNDEATLDTALHAASVFRVMPENVTGLWPQLAALFQPALDINGTHSVEDVRRSIMAMQSQLWVRMVMDEVVAAATSEFISYPAGLYLRVWLVGAIPDRPMEMQSFCDTLEQWRVANKCIGFEAVGRLGWLRVFPWMRMAGIVMRGVP